MKKLSKNEWVTPTAVATGAVVGAAGLAFLSPFVRKELMNLVKTRGRINAADMTKAIPEGAKKDAQAILKHLQSQGIDPLKAKISMTGAGGTGKTTLSKALASAIDDLGRGASEAQHRGVHVHAPRARRHANLDMEAKHTFAGWDLRGYKPRPGSVSEQTLLLTQVDPKDYDALIHLERPYSVVRKQLLDRGKGATQAEAFNYPLLQSTTRNAFELTDGAATSITPHIKVKLKPPGGFNADKALDRELAKLNISPKGMTRGDKVLSATKGKKSKYRDLITFFRKDRPLILAGGGVAGGIGGGVASSQLQKSATPKRQIAAATIGVTSALSAAGLLGGALSKNKEKPTLKTHRRIQVGGEKALLDREIKLFRDVPKDPADLAVFLRKKIEGAKATRWSHPQIAIPASVNLSKLQGAGVVRLSVPLPGETALSRSIRAGKLHAHIRGPVHLVHLDHEDPKRGPLNVIRHMPETMAAFKARKTTLPFLFKEAAKKLRVIYIDETGAGHRSQANNVVRAAQKAGIDAEAVDFTSTFLKKKRLGKGYRKAYMRFLEEKSLGSVVPLVQAHRAYHGGVDEKKKARFLEENKDSALLLAHPHLEGQFTDVEQDIGVLHTDPVKWPFQYSPKSEGKRLHIGSKGVVSKLDTPHKKEVSGLAVSPDVLKKRVARSGLMDKKKFNITVSAGGEALEVPEMVAEVLKSDLPDYAEVHAVAGRNTKALKSLQRMAKKDSRLQVHGFAPLSKMMREANLNVIRAHGTSYAETLASGKPAVYYGPKFQMLDMQGLLTRRTAVHGGEATSYPVAVGLDELPGAVEEAQDKYDVFTRQAKKLQSRYGDPASQIAKAVTK